MHITNNHLIYLCFLSLIFLTTQSSSSSSSIISRFQEYLQINTAYPNPNYYEAVDFILTEAKSLNLEFQTIEFVKNKPLVLLKWQGKDPNLQSVLLNSHTDVVPAEPHKWKHHPFGAHIDSHGNIYARGSQDMKCVGMQYLEAIRKLKDSGFEPTRTIYLSFVPDEENGGLDGALKLAESNVFEEMNVAFVLDEGMPSPNEKYQVFYAERSLMWLVIKATGAPGHGAKLYDNTAMENLLKSVESIRSFRASQFDMVKAGLKAEGDVVSVNMVFLKAGTQTPTGFVMNLQPSEAEAGFDIRIPPTADQVSLEKRIAEEWAPASRNMTFEFVQKDPLLDIFGKPILTVANNSNPWWVLFEEAILNAGGTVETPEILLGSTDASFFRQRGVPALGFSAIANTPDRVHDHDEDMKSVGMQYLEAIRKLRDSGFEPTRTIYLSYVPDEEIGGRDGAEKLAKSDLFKEMNVAFVLDEGRPSADEKYRAYYAERSPMWLVIKAKGAPGHGAKLYDNSAMENLLESIESIRRYRASEFDMIKAGLKTEGELLSINLVYLKAGTESPSGFVMNMQPSEAEAGIDIRLPPTADQEALEMRIAQEWAPVSRNMTFKVSFGHFKDPILNKFVKPAVTVADSSNPWWVLLEEAVLNAGGTLGKPDIFRGGTDARFYRQQGLPAIGFSPVANTPGLAHDHNEFINQHEYLKGIDIYASIIKTCTSYAEQSVAEASKDEL